MFFWLGSFNNQIFVQNWLDILDGLRDFRWHYLSNYVVDKKVCNNILDVVVYNFSKFYGKVGAISWFLFHLIWKNYVLYWDFYLKSWIMDCQNFSVENNYFLFTFFSYSLLHEPAPKWFFSEIQSYTIQLPFK